MISFKTTPFVRIILPFLAGIYFCHSFGINWNTYYVLTATAFAIGFLHLTEKKNKISESKWLILFLCDAFLVLSACYCCYVYNIRNRADFYGHFVSKEKQTWNVSINELPAEKDNFYKLKLNVITSVKEGKSMPVAGDMIAYFKKPFDAAVLKTGNVLQITARFTEINKPLNPFEFDYNNFMAQRNVYYQTFIDARDVKLISVKSNSFNLFHFGLAIKQGIRSRFKNSGLEDFAANLCTALITGYDDDIDRDTINAFAHSGTLHVLSVSGLHVGILYAVLLFFLGLVDKNKKYKLVQTSAVLLALFFFTLITGFSPPVMRAAIMLSLLMIGRFYFDYNGGNGMNIIAVSAFAMLLFDPLLLFDAGFLLSYSAIIGIIYFEPYFSGLMATDNYFLKKVWQLSSVSIAAQIGTLPFALLLFHQFPAWFIFTNFLIIPICSVIMLLGSLILLKIDFLVPLINLLSKVITYCIQLTDSPGTGYIDRIDFSASDALFLTSFILATSLLIKSRSFLHALAMLIILIVWQTNSIAQVYFKKSSASIGIYHVNHYSCVDLKNTTNLFCETDYLGSNYDFHIKPNHTFYNYSDQFSINPDYVRKGNASFFHLKNRSMLKFVAGLSPDFVLLSNQTKISDRLLSEMSPKLIIADGTNSHSFIKELREQCRKFGVEFYSTKEKGYLNLELP